MDFEVRFLLAPTSGQPGSSHYDGGFTEVISGAVVYKALELVLVGMVLQEMKALSILHSIQDVESWLESKTFLRGDIF